MRESGRTAYVKTNLTETHHWVPPFKIRFVLYYVYLYIVIDYCFQSNESTF